MQQLKDEEHCIFYCTFSRRLVLYRII